MPRVGDEVRQNFLLSPCLNSAAGHQLLIQEAYSSAAEAYNNAIDRSVNDLMVFVHQDVVLPFTWMSQLRLALKELDVMDLIGEFWAAMAYVRTPHMSDICIRLASGFLEHRSQAQLQSRRLMRSF